MACLTCLTGPPPAGQACQPTCQLPGPASRPRSETGLKCQPQTSLRPTSARLLTCLTCLRLALGPAQPATRHPASGPSVYETGLAHPATRPSTAQPSPPSPSSRHNHGFAAQRARSGLSNVSETGLRRPSTAQPSTPSRSCRRNQHQHPATETSFRPSPTSNPPKQTSPKPTLFQTRRPQPI